MQGKRNKWIFGLAGLACVACCAVPLAGILLAGAGSAAVIAFFSSGLLKEIVLCMIPLLLLVAGSMFYIKRKNARACCDGPSADCNNSQCGISSEENKVA